MKKLLTVLFVLVCAMTFAFANGTTEGTSANYPDGPIEITVTANPGGGSDKLARAFADVCQKYQFVTVPMTITNKPGGGGATGQAYFNSKTNPDYNLLAFNTASLLVSLTAGTHPKTSWTYVANMATDNQVLVVSADSQFKSWADVEAYMKKNPGSLTVGCADDQDEMTLILLEQNTGVKFNHTAYFAGSAETTTALLGGHIELGILNPVECIGLVEGKRLKVIGSFAPERIDAPFDDVPTFKELGYKNCVVQMSRGIIGPEGMSKEVQKFWSDVCEKVFATPEWQNDYLEKNVLGKDFLPYKDFEKFIVGHEQSLKDFIATSNL